MIYFLAKKNEPVLGFSIAVLIRPVGELVVNSFMVLPGQPTSAITISIVKLPIGVPIQAK